MRVLALAACIVLASCRPAEPPPVRDAGPRIVSLSPAASVMLRQAGLEDAVVGRHGWDAVLDPGVPTAGDQTGLDYERLAVLDPTHVVIEPGATGIPARLTELAERDGALVVPVRTLTLEDIEGSARAIAGAFGDAAPRGRELLDAAARLGAVRDARPSWGRVLLVVSVSPAIDCLGPGSAHHELLVNAGFTPALAEGAPWVTLSVEDVMRLDPAAIVLIQPASSPDAGSGPIGGRLGGLAGRGIAAERLGRLVLIDEPLALVPGTNLVEIGGLMREGLDALGPLPSPRE